ncbi:glycerate kinase [Acaricomes phytoseiuli]|uniref:glycerate kinase n=1 Tax=Acaricomes phytoseiuli TaxID=291968 RepID=UPI0003710CCA|nr:glycerate kinase [Acaricomes phytoseiuli]MCW1249703.1 glycerate kinase [Acaricomes phytoseiuli]
MRILIAPDAFKGSLDAAEAAAAMAEGAYRVYPEAELDILPIADGGEGTVAAAVAEGFNERISAVTGPILKPTAAAWALSPERSAAGHPIAVIEVAQASGFMLSERTPEHALRAHSYGVGQLIAAALEAGAREIVLGLGGSAMTDAGSGALRALGLQVLDRHGALIPLGGGQLVEAAAIDLSGLDPRLAQTTIRLAADVQNPLYGPSGTARVFAAQKGADADGVEQLEAGIRHFASLLRETTGVDPDQPGAGAAGGLAAGFISCTGAQLESGAELISRISGLPGRISRADLVLTGEGRLDQQTLSGKAPAVVARTAREHGVPVIAVAGQLALPLEELEAFGFTAAISAAEAAGSAEAALAEPARYLTLATTEVLTGA